MTTFNAPPRWPEPPDPDWVPPEGWNPHSTWGEVPSGWRLWADSVRTDDPAQEGGRPLALSEDLPASGARPPEPVRSYPITVHQPGIWETRDAEPAHYNGFSPPRERRRRPRARLAIIIALLLAGLLLAAVVTIGFVRLTGWAQSTLPENAAAAQLAVGHEAPAPPL